MSIVYSKLNRRSFSSQSGAAFIASWLIGSNSVTERTSDDQRLRSLDDMFLLQSSPE